MGIIIIGVFLFAYGLYVLLKKEVTISNEYSDEGCLLSGPIKNFYSAIIFLIGIFLIVWGISHR